MGEDVKIIYGNPWSRGTYLQSKTADPGYPGKNKQSQRKATIFMRGKQ